MHFMGIDTGGTFTDTVLVDSETGTVVAVKTPTTGDLVSGLLAGIDRACERAGIDFADVDAFCHGNTIAVNALIEGDGAKTALVTTRGFRDVLELAEGFRDASLLYNPCGEHEPPLIPRRHRYEVTERVLASGEVLEPLDDDDVDRVVGRLDEEGIESVAICFLHAYRTPDHEIQFERVLRERLPDVSVSRSSSVSPEIREYSRTATTAVDAFVKPRVGAYLSTLSGELEARGLSTSINIMKSDGGLARPNVAAKRPITQTISGPVAGIEAAKVLGEEIGTSNLITFDMGGTSCDTGIVVDGAPDETPSREVQGMKINGPFVNLNTVGAGGGSIAWLDDVGALRVGPRSAGSEPGPACYGRGGVDPTVTDADLVLGILNAEAFAGGLLELDADAARTALERIADPLDLTVEEAAIAVRDVIDTKMAAAVRAVSVEQAHDPRDFALVGFGGAGPMHACRVGLELGIDTVVFPNQAGLTSAMGLLFADIKHDYVRTVIARGSDVDLAALNETIDELIADGEADLESEEVPPGDRSFAVSFDVRYEGQAHHLTVPANRRSITDDELAAVLDRFERSHDEQYGFVDDRDSIVLAAVRVTATGHLPHPTVGGGSANDADHAPKRGERDVILDAETTASVPFYDWGEVVPSQTVEGPAVIEMENSTIWVPPSFDATMDARRNVVARTEAA